MLADLQEAFVIVCGDGIYIVAAFTLAGGILLALADATLALARRLG